MYIQDIICRQGVGGAFPIRGGISKNTQKFGENSESGGRMKKQTLFMMIVSEHFYFPIFG